MSRIFLLFFFILFLLTPFFSSASGEVFINEVAWMGTEESPHDEWIELYNNSSTTFSLDDWFLKIGNKNINLKGKIKPKSFFILERTDEKTLPAIKADQIYSGSLQNNGETLVLINGNKEIVDKVDCSKGWLEGDNESKRTMERKENKWQTSSKIGGTPKKENSEGSSKKTEKYIDLNLASSNSIKYKKFTLVFLISFITALLSAIIVLSINKRNKSN